MTHVGVVGRRASGKGTVAEYLKQAYGFDHIMTSDVLFEEAVKLGWMQPNERADRKKLQDAGFNLKKQFGQDVFSQLVMKKMQPGRKYVIEGTRGILEQKTYFDVLGKEYACIGVEAPQRLRYERLVGRGQGWTWEEFLKTEEHPIETVIDDLMKNVNYRIENTGSRKDLTAKVDDVMKELGITRSSPG